MPVVKLTLYRLENLQTTASEALRGNMQVLLTGGVAVAIDEQALEAAGG